MTATRPYDMTQLQQALAASNQPQLRRLVAVETADGVHISGRVPTYYLKSMAIETAKQAAGDRPVVLSIDVGN